MEDQDMEKRGPGRPPAPKGIDVSDLLKAMAEQQDRQNTAMREMIQDLKKPSEYEQRKIDKEIAADQRKLKDKEANARALVMGREQRMKGCTHTTYHPLTKMANHTWTGQWHTPANQTAYFIPTCSQCQTQLPRIFSLTGDVSNGVNLHEYANVDIDRLLNDSVKSGNAEEVKAFRSEHHLVA